MRQIHSERPNVMPSMVCRSEKRLLIVASKIKCTFVFEGLFEGPLKQIKNYGVMWYKES